jgi:ElaB/YqjD/DUF883 family membrane-anchored ribosome-binding protein
MTHNGSGSNLESSETEQSIKNAYKSTRPGGSETHLPVKKSPWKSAVIGALIGFILLIALIMVMSYLFGRFG